MPEIKFNSEAKREYSEAYQWYEAQNPGLGEKFLREISASFEVIRQHPLLYPVALKGVRKMPVKRFPYRILYSIEDDKIRVWAVFHTSRDPRIWQKRIRRGIGM